MAHRKTERNPLFSGRWFEDDIILLCLRWYFRFKLSYRDRVAILGERGLSIREQDHRRVKGRLRPIFGFKTFYNARRVIIGIELAQKIQKRQFAIPIPWRSNPALIWRNVMAA